MDLPLLPPVKPMLAKAATKLPTGDGLFYELKWDGFRCVVFRDGDEVELGSRNDRPLTRYFPEMLAPLRAALPEKVDLGLRQVLEEDGVLFTRYGVHRSLLH